MRVFGLRVALRTLIIAALSLSLAGCSLSAAPKAPSAGSHPSSDGPSASTPPSTPPKNGFSTSPAKGQTLHLARQTPIATLDPAKWEDAQSATYMEAIYSTLVTYAKDSTAIVPALATSWTATDGGKTLTFTLRQGVQFSNGDPFTSADVVASLNWVTNPKAEAPYADVYQNIVGFNAYQNNKATSLAGVTADGPYAVVIRLKVPEGAFMNVLAMESSAMLDHLVLERSNYTNYDGAPVGTGPFMVKSWVHGKRLVLVQNPNWWGTQKPYLSEVDVAVGLTPSQQLAAFSKGTLDAIGVPAQTYLKVVSDPTLKALYHSAVENGLWYVGINVKDTETKALADPAVRRAMNLAINKKALIQAVWDGRGQVANGVLPPSMPGYDPTLKPYPYDPQEAKTLLANAGYKNGFTITYATPNDPQDMTWAHMVQKDLKAVGITANIKPMKWNVFLTYISSPTPQKPPTHVFGIYNLGWTPEDYPDPQDFFDNLLSKQAIGGTNNTWWTDPTFESLIAKADAMPASEDAQRYALYKQAAAIVHQEAPYIFVAFPVNDILVHNWMGPDDPNVWLHPALGMQLKDIWKHGGS